VYYYIEMINSNPLGMTGGTKVIVGVGAALGLGVGAGVITDNINSRLSGGCLL